MQTIYMIGVVITPKALGESKDVVNFLVEALPQAVIDHGPKSTKVLSASWREPELITALIDDFGRQALGFEQLLSGADFSIGLLRLDIESTYALEFRPLAWLEWIIKHLHEEFESVGSLWYYLIERDGRFKLTSLTTMHTPRTKEFNGEEVDWPGAREYAQLLYEYLYEESLTSYSHAKAAKLHLCRSII
jgi:hypothetical protein